VLQNRRDLLIIFVKNPERGKVKTRLAAEIGNEKALEIYQKLITYTRKVVQELPVTKQVWYSSFIDSSDEWDSDQFQKKLQKGKDLGARILEAFSQGFDDGFRRIVIIGSDCPALREEHLIHAFKKLQFYDVVLGPSQDGGYYLLGMNHYIPEVFKGKSWSSESLYGETVRTLDNLNKRWYALDELNDIDTIEDLNKSYFEID